MVEAVGPFLQEVGVEQCAIADYGIADRAEPVRVERVGDSATSTGSWPSRSCRPCGPSAPRPACRPRPGSDRPKLDEERRGSRSSRGRSFGPIGRQVLHAVEVGVAQFEVIGGVVAPEGLLDVVIPVIVAVPMRVVLHRAGQKQAGRNGVPAIGAPPRVKRLVPEILQQRDRSMRDLRARPEFRRAIAGSRRPSGRPSSAADRRATAPIRLISAAGRPGRWPSPRPRPIGPLCRVHAGQHVQAGLVDRRHVERSDLRATNEGHEQIAEAIRGDADRAGKPARWPTGRLPAWAPGARTA